MRHLDSSRPSRVDFKRLPATESPGCIIVRGNGEDQRFVINMLGQLFPGRPKFPESSLDGTAARQGNFKSCLEKIGAIDGIQSVAFPFKIGSDLAGGDWNTYRSMIEKFAERNPNITVYIVRKTD